MKKQQDTLCKRCTKCCSYFCTQLDFPEEREDFEDLAWILAHENVSFHVVDDEWHLMVKNKCRFLNKDGGCDIYDTRPKICRDHDPEECDFGAISDKDYDDVDIVIETLDELYEYRDKNFPI